MELGNTATINALNPLSIDSYIRGSTSVGLDLSTEDIFDWTNASTVTIQYTLTSVTSKASVGVIFWTEEGTYDYGKIAKTSETISINLLSQSFQYYNANGKLSGTKKNNGFVENNWYNYLRLGRLRLFLIYNFYS